MEEKIVVLVVTAGQVGKGRREGREVSNTPFSLAYISCAVSAQWSPSWLCKPSAFC